MRLTVRRKLMAIVATAGLAFVVLISIGSIIARRSDEQVAAIRDRYLPKVELAAHLEAQFDRLGRTLQDAVAAHDAEGLIRAREHKDVFLNQLDAARAVIDPADGAALRSVFEDYYGRAADVSRRLISGETGEAVVASMALMQARQARTLELLRKAAAFDRAALASAFAAVENARVAASRIELLVGLACLVVVIALSLWVSRGLIASVSQLASGFERFGLGFFDRPIATIANDELGELAQRANQMAANLGRLGEERDRVDWMKRGVANLAQELRGELEPAQVAERALRVLAKHLDAPVAAFYGLDEEQLRPLARYAGSPQDSDRPPTFRLGEGLLGEAALRDELFVLHDPPHDYIRVRSGLGESAPRAIAILPLRHVGRTLGAIEVATLKPWSELAGELLSSVRETVVLALEAAQGRARLRALLSETQQQAQRLGVQEEELRATNEELQAQQEELRQTNEELAAQAEALAAQQRMLEERNKELDEARRVLEQKAAELSSVSAYKSQFLANMSHELRTPLNSMLLLSNLLAENASGNLTPKQVEYGRTINTSGKDLLALINQVLDLSKIEAGKQEVQLEEVGLRPLLAHMERVFEPLARDRGLSLSFEIDLDTPEAVTTDRQRLEQILRNLLGNAIKFTERGGVKLRARALADTLELSVVDTGIGIAPEHQERVFAPFEQVDAAADRRHGGTGLGLAIARQLAALLGGDLRLESELGKGSVFTLTLPRGTPTLRPRPAEARVLPAPSRPRNESGAVLVIEDDQHFADELCALIAAQGIEHLVAPDGRTGLKLAKERHPAGIILDVRLPDLDGWAVMAELRAAVETAAIPVHFVSAVESSKRAMAMGAIGYLTKPATREDLVRAIEAVAPIRRARPCRVLVAEDDAAVGDSLVKQLATERLEVERVSTARLTLEALARSRFDCLVLDLALPDMDGLELLQTIDKQIKDKPAVVVCTARALTRSETQRLEAYAEAIVVRDGYFQDRLVEEVRLFIRRLKEGLAPRRQGAKGPSAGELKLTGKKILLVDDDMRTVYALSATLIGKGAEVLTADTGVAALEMLDKHPDVHVVLMDVMMPEMDGYEATRRIRKQKRFTSLPIIALTAKAMKGDAEKCLEAGVSDYMSKPIDSHRLLELIVSRISGGRA